MTARMGFRIIQKILSTGRFEKKKEIRKTQKILRRLRKPLDKRTRLSQRSNDNADLTKYILNIS